MQQQLDSLKQPTGTGISVTENTVTPAVQPFTGALRQGRWLVAMQISKKLLAILQAFILARYLLPEDFGLFGIVLLAAATIEILSQETGIRTALIQRQDDLRPYLDTAWTIHVVQGFLRGILLFSGAGMIAQFFGEAQATGLIQVYALVIIIYGLENIGVVYFFKDLQFHKQFILIVSSEFIGAVLTVALAIITGSVWALITGMLCTVCSRVLLSYALHSYRPRLRIDWQRYRELFRFSGWVWLASMLAFFRLQGDNLVVGRILGASMLGYYRLAFSIAGLTGTEIGNTLGRMMLPLYSRQQREVAELRSSYLQLTRLQSLLVMPLTLGMVTLAPELVRVFLGPNWEAVIAPLQILAFYNVLNASTRKAEVLLEARGIPRYSTTGRALFLIVGAVLIIPLTYSFQLIGVALAVVGAGFANWLYDEWRVHVELELRPRNMLWAYATGALPALSMGLILLALGTIFPVDNPLIRLFVLVPTGAGTYLGLLLLTAREDVYQLRNLLPSRYRPDTPDRCVR